MQNNLVRLSDVLMAEVHSDNGGKNYNVSDVFLSKNGFLKGVILTGMGMLAVKYYADRKDIKQFAQNTLRIDCAVRIGKKEIKNATSSFKNLINKQVLYENGGYIGTLSDIYINTEKLKVMAVEVARSFFEDLFTGRIIIPGHIITDGTHGIKISEIQLENSLHNTKGIINVIDDGLDGER